MTIGKPRPGGALPPSGTGESAEALRARGAEREAVIHGPPFMLARLGRDMRYRFISSAYARMIARRSEDVIGKHVADWWLLDRPLSRTITSQVRIIPCACPASLQSTRVCLRFGAVPI